MMAEKTLGEKIRIRRRELRLSQEKFAEKLYVSRQIVANCETGRTDIKMSLFLDMANVLELSPKCFFDGTY